MLGDGSNPYLIGRLWRVLSSNQGDGNTDVEEVYDYDEFGNVASKTLTVTGYAAQTVRYEYDNLGNVIKIHYPDHNNSIPEVVYSYNSLGETLAKDGRVYTILKDHLGSTRVVVDEAGTVIAGFDYLPFGDLMGVAYGNPEIISYRYTGQEFDAELGLYNYRARFYDSRLGRFYGVDSKAQFPSPYLYAGNWWQRNPPQEYLR